MSDKAKEPWQGHQEDRRPDDAGGGLRAHHRRLANKPAEAIDFVQEKIDLVEEKAVFFRDEVVRVLDGYLGKAEEFVAKVIEYIDDLNPSRWP